MALKIFKYFTVMKVNKNKNSSFITNHQLIEGLKNRSARSLNRNKSSQTTISLIQRKNFDQNISPNIQIQTSTQQSPNKSHRSRQKSLCTPKSKNHNESHRQSKVNNNFEPTKHEAALLAKIEQLYMQKNKLKKEKKMWQQKCKDEMARNEMKESGLKKENQKLHKLIIKQSQLIANQSNHSNSQEKQEFHRILHAQALALQSKTMPKYRKFL